MSNTQDVNNDKLPFKLDLQLFSEKGSENLNPKNPMTGGEWNRYFQEQYGKDNVYWSNPFHSVSIGELSQEAQKAFQGYSSNGWQGNYSGQEGNALGKPNAGKVWDNNKSQLPTNDASGNMITYKEFDVNPPGLNGRDGYRFVTGSDGNVYYSPDHYATFQKVR